MIGHKRTGGVNETSTTVLNNSVDHEFDQLATELLSYNPLSQDADGNIVGGLMRVTTKALGDFVANDIEETGNLTYIGFENLDGDYFIQKIDATSGKSIRFATIVNNPTLTSYADAWTARADGGTVYDTYGTAFTP